MIAATQHYYVIAFEFVDKPMLLVDSSGPIARKLKFELLRSAYTGLWISNDIFE
jgi:hypothetical protein